MIDRCCMTFLQMLSWNYFSGNFKPFSVERSFIFSYFVFKCSYIALERLKRFKVLCIEYRMDKQCNNNAFSEHALRKITNPARVVRSRKIMRREFVTSRGSKKSKIYIDRKYYCLNEKRLSLTRSTQFPIHGLYMYIGKPVTQHCGVQHETFWKFITTIAYFVFLITHRLLFNTLFSNEILQIEFSSFSLLFLSK